MTIFVSSLNQVRIANKNIIKCRGENFLFWFEIKLRNYGVINYIHIHIAMFTENKSIRDSICFFFFCSFVGYSILFVDPFRISFNILGIGQFCKSAISRMDDCSYIPRIRPITSTAPHVGPIDNHHPRHCWHAC